jgi:hypothetical protein
VSTDISLQSTSYQVANRQWLLAEPDVKLNVTLDISKFNATGTSEVQTATIGGTPTGGTFTLTLAGQTTTAIAFNATAATVQAALAALSNVGTGNVTVTGSAGGPYTITFGGVLAAEDIPALTHTDSLTGGSSPAVTIATSTAGGNAHYPNGYIPSGCAIGKVTATGLFGPYDDSASDGRQTLYGFTYGDVRAVRQNGTTAAKVGTSAVVYDAIVSVSKLPFQFGPGAVDTNGKADVPALRFEA